MRIFISILVVFSFCKIGAQPIIVDMDTQIIQTPSILMTSAYPMDFKELMDAKFRFNSQQTFYQKPVSLMYLNSTNHLPGMFCKMEYNIERKSKLSPRFRLGSLNYTEWMEGKRELYNRY